MCSTCVWGVWLLSAVACAGWAPESFPCGSSQLLCDSDGLLAPGPQQQSVLHQLGRGQDRKGHWLSVAVMRRAVLPAPTLAADGDGAAPSPSPSRVERFTHFAHGIHRRWGVANDVSGRGSIMLVVALEDGLWMLDSGGGAAGGAALTRTLAAVLDRDDKAHRRAIATATWQCSWLRAQNCCRCWHSPMAHHLLPPARRRCGCCVHHGSGVIDSSDYLPLVLVLLPQDI